MKNFIFQLLFSFLCLGLLITVSCNQDPDDTLPQLSTLTGAGLSIDKDSLKIGSTTKISFKVVKGGNALNTITVQANGVNLIAGSFNINGVPSAANPALLFGGDRDSLVYTYEFNRIDTPQLVTYIFTVKDDAANSFHDTVSIKYYGTPASEIGKNLIVYNYHGTKFGGLDLFNIKVVSGNAPEATIRDFGVVDPVSNSTWVMRFTPLNNSEIRNPPANYLYDNLIYKENIQRAYELGDREPGIVTSKTLAKGDFFLVKNNNDYFAIIVNSTNTTTNNNDDSYDLSFKR